MDVTRENMEPEFVYSDNEEVLPETHNKLLNAVSQIYKKQRIEKPKRNEPTTIISEFNLSNSTASNRKLVNVSDLVNTLKEKATYNEIRNKVRSIQRKAKTLPKPMEKLHADRIKREAGYSSVRSKLNRWEAVVQRNRAADQLRFPRVPIKKVTENDSHNFLKTFKKPTELEEKIAEILQINDNAPEDEKDEEEQVFPLSLEEIIEKRKMVARMRARESYRISKAVRQNKIKSKRYHRILKREKIRKELKDFEILQQTDPEAALEKLEKIERARAEERITLRHRNTGKWAKSKAIRAKYDSQARAELAEQLAKSRELTRKVRSGINSSSEGEASDREEKEELLQTDSTNPWIGGTKKSESEVTAFRTGFKKFQLDKEKELSSLNDSLDADSNESRLNTGLNDETKNSSIQSPSNITDEVNAKSGIESVSSEDEDSCVINESNVEKKTNNVSENKSYHLNKICDINTTEKTTNLSEKGLCKESTLNRHLQNNSTSSPKKKIKTKKKRLSNVVNKSGQWAILTNDQEGRVNKIENTVAIDKIFDSAEDSLKNTLDNRINSLKLDLVNKGKPKSNKIIKTKYKPDLSMVSSRKKPDIDSALLEVGNEGISGGDNDIKNLMQVYDSNKKNERKEVPNIDPTKFLPAKPSKLNSDGLQLLEDHVESDEENDKNKHLNLEEAFADDDVIEEFRREKEEDIENSKPKTVDLTLPGWGSWGGQDVDDSNQIRKRKNRRLIVKFPELPRKDQQKDYIIINEEVAPALKKHMVHDLPFPFKSVKDYETSIRAPIGNTWVPQSAFMKYIKPAVLTRLGAIIKPMDESEIVNFKKRKLQKKKY